MPTAPKPAREARKGRPSKQEIADSAEQIKSARAFPEPPRSTIKNGAIPSEKFWDYRAKLPAEFLPRLTFYIYREWPKLDMFRGWTPQMHAELKARTRKRPKRYIAKYADIDHKDWRNQLLQFHGSGN